MLGSSDMVTAKALIELFFCKNIECYTKALFVAGEEGTIETDRVVSEDNPPRKRTCERVGFRRL
jgi:hypothetical protein